MQLFVYKLQNQILSVCTYTTIYLDIISVVSSHGIKNPAQEKNVCFGTHFLKGSCTSVLRDM